MTILNRILNLQEEFKVFRLIQLRLSYLKMCY